MTHTPRTTAAEPSPDLGFSLLEILLIVMLSGILSAIVVYSVSGMTASASDGTCAVEQRILYTATEAYFNQTETNQIAPTGTDEDRYERTLAEGGFLRSVSDVLTLHADGTVTTENDGPC